MENMEGDPVTRGAESNVGSRMLDVIHNKERNPERYFK